MIFDTGRRVYDAAKRCPGPEFISERSREVIAQFAKPSTRRSASPSVADPQWSVSRKQLADILDTAYAEIAMTVLVAINLVLAIVLVDTEAGGQDVPLWLELSMKLFVVVYCIEVSARVFVHRLEFFLSPGNLFDFVLVVADVVGTLNELLSEKESFVDFAIFRIVRAFRLLRSARIMIWFRSLYLLTNGVTGAMRAVMWSFLMISLVLVLCSIFAVSAIQPLVTELASTGNVFDGCQRCGVAYSSVWHAYVTFFQQSVAGDSWGTVTIQVMDAHPWTALFFIPSFLVINLGLLNIILAVIVDSAEDAREANNVMRLELKGRDFKQAHSQLEQMCAQMDADNSGELSLDELMEAYDNNHRFYETIRLMDIDKEDMKIVFNILDQDKSGACTYAEFVESLWKMKTQDSHTLLVFIKSYVTDVKHTMEESIRVLKNDIGIKLAELHAVHKRYLEDDRTSNCTSVPGDPNDEHDRSPVSGCRERAFPSDAFRDARFASGFAALLDINSRKIEQKLDALFQHRVAPYLAGDARAQAPSDIEHLCNHADGQVCRNQQPPQHQRQQQRQQNRTHAFDASGNAKLPKALHRTPELVPPPDLCSEGGDLGFPDISFEPDTGKLQDIRCDGDSFVSTAARCDGAL